MVLILLNYYWKRDMKCMELFEDQALSIRLGQIIFIIILPTNLYGPNDNYNLETSPVLPALIRKIHLGKCLENNDWEAIRKDLKKYPIEGVNDTKSENEILEKLSKYGIKYVTTRTWHQAPTTL